MEFEGTAGHEVARGSPGSSRGVWNCVRSDATRTRTVTSIKRFKLQLQASRESSLKVWASVLISSCEAISLVAP